MQLYWFMFFCLLIWLEFWVLKMLWLRINLWNNKIIKQSTVSFLWTKIFNENSSNKFCPRIERILPLPLFFFLHFKFYFVFWLCKFLTNLNEVTVKISVMHHPWCIEKALQRNIKYNNKTLKFDTTFNISHF